MKYFYDTEFLEGTQTKRYLGMRSNLAFPLAGLILICFVAANFYFESVTWSGVILALIAIRLGSYGFLPALITKPTIDLISIGIVAEDGRELYLISKDFNLREAWNRYQITTGYNHGDMRNHIGDKWDKKEYWIRENVLGPIFNELAVEDGSCWLEGEKKDSIISVELPFTYKNLKHLINKYGYTNAEIAEKVKCFVANVPIEQAKGTAEAALQYNPIKLYGYYADYDHVVLCWLFGKMIDLPEGLPKYTIDLQQELDRCQKNLNKIKKAGIDWKTIQGIDYLTDYPNYPKQTNEHSAIHDARFNKELYDFIKSL